MEHIPLGSEEDAPTSSLGQHAAGISDEYRVFGAFGTRPLTSFIQAKPPGSFALRRIRGSLISDAIAHIDIYLPPVSLERQMRGIALFACLMLLRHALRNERGGW